MIVSKERIKKGIIIPYQTTIKSLLISDQHLEMVQPRRQGTLQPLFTKSLTTFLTTTLTTSIEKVFAKYYVPLAQQQSKALQVLESTAAINAIAVYQEKVASVANNNKQQQFTITVNMAIRRKKYQHTHTITK
jgi:hypothetical protein